MNLKKLIRENGKPDILIDNYNNRLNKGIAIWGILDKIIFDYNGVKKNNKIINSNPLNFLDITIKEWKNDSNDIAAVGFISYDIKNYLYPHIRFKESKRLPYYWFIRPAKIAYYDINSFINIETTPCLQLKKDILDIRSFSNKIKRIKKELKDGNAYQINFTMEKTFNINKTPFELYLMMRNISKPEFGYYINMENKQILSFSPEQFFNSKDSIVKSFPMKGTRPRSDNLKEDNNLKEALKKSKEDKAEHLMIIDLLRNDIGKFSKFGSVKVSNLFNVKSYETVHQMVSEITGNMIENIEISDIIKSLCPGGSITGAPKESAMKIIDDLENYNRGIYTGSIGHIKNNGEMNFNIAIRTMYIDNNIASYPVGGGIVWDSNSNDEWNEAQLKSKILDKCIIS